MERCVEGQKRGARLGCDDMVRLNYAQVLIIRFW